MYITLDIVKYVAGNEIGFPCKQDSTKYRVICFLESAIIWYQEIADYLEKYLAC